ncbi:hypothetical protein [Asanoa sp. NPDC050611]|uniref:hypothetical protein n=1 Tax=Asanoa sp. NPDC050611 TaxID=3157098 RepID=UPI0033F2D3F2
MDGVTIALVVAAVLVVGAVGVLLRRRRSARRAAADPLAAGRDAICGMVRHQQQQAKGSIRGHGLGQNSGFTDPGTGF